MPWLGRDPEDDVCDPSCANPDQYSGGLEDCDNTDICPSGQAFCYYYSPLGTGTNVSGICAYQIDCTGLTSCASVGDAACGPDEICIARPCATAGQFFVPVSQLCPTPVPPDDTAVIPNFFGPDMSR